MEFRRDHDEIWHCSPACQNWPGDSFNVIRIEKLPVEFDLCTQCKTLRAPVGILVPANPARRWACMALPLLLLILGSYVADCFARWVREE